MNTERSNDNFVPSLRVKSNAADNADVLLWADPSTHRLLVDITGGSGTSATDDAAFTAGSGAGTPIMGFVTTDAVDAGDVGVVRMTTARSLHVHITGNDVASGGTSMTDDAAFTPGTTAVTPLGAMFDDTLPDSVDEGDGGVVRMSGNRNLYVTLRDAAGNERGLNIAADGSLAITVATIPSHAVTNAGTFAVQVDGSALTALQKIDDPVLVDDAAFTPATSSVMMAGFQFDDTLPDSVDEGDAGAARMSANRNQYIQIRDAAGNERGVNVDASGQLAVAGPVTNAGTFAVQENGAALTALQLIDNAIGVEDAAETAGGGLMMSGTVRRDTAASSAGTTGDNATLNTDSLGRLWISGAAVEDVAETAGGILLMVGSVRRDTAASSAGTTGDNATINTDSVGALWTRDTATQVDDAAFTPATGRIMPVGYLADESSTDSIDEGDAGIPRMTLDRKQIVTPQAHTNGGGTPAKLVSAASTNATSLKGSAGQVYTIAAFNINAAVRYLKLYNKATAPTVGTDTPVQVYAIPGATTGGGFTIAFPVGMEFTTGIAYALTTGITDADTGAVAASEILVNIIYK